jgi:hypothetical protein
MLRLDPAERATVPEIFNHFWLRSSSGSSGSSSNAPELKRDRSYSTGLSSGASYLGSHSVVPSRAVSPMNARRELVSKRFMRFS